jgi:hypothetical protein
VRAAYAARSLARANKPLWLCSAFSPGGDEPHFLHGRLSRTRRRCDRDGGRGDNKARDQQSGGGVGENWRSMPGVTDRPSRDWNVSVAIHAS